MLLTHEITTRHLTPPQCEILKQLVGRRCEIRGTGVVEVLQAGVTDAGCCTWLHVGYGVMCLVKDHPGKQYIFKAYDLTKRIEILSHRITTKFKYITRTERFHYMTGSKNCITGLNFVDETEATMFKNEVDKKQQKWKFPRIPPHPEGLPDYNPEHAVIEDIRSYLPSTIPTVGNHILTPKSVDWKKDSPLTQIKHEILDT